MKIRLADKKRHSDGTKRTISSEKIIFFCGSVSFPNPFPIGMGPGRGLCEGNQSTAGRQKSHSDARNAPFQVKKSVFPLSEGYPLPKPTS
jgi:hypothetical protein